MAKRPLPRRPLGHRNPSLKTGRDRDKGFIETSDGFGVGTIARRVSIEDDGRVFNDCRCARRKMMNGKGIKEMTSERNLPEIDD